MRFNGSAFENSRNEYCIGLPPCPTSASVPCCVRFKVRLRGSAYVRPAFRAGVQLYASAGKEYHTATV